MKLFVIPVTIRTYLVETEEIVRLWAIQRLPLLISWKLMVESISRSRPLEVKEAVAGIRTEHQAGSYIWRLPSCLNIMLYCM